MECLLEEMRIKLSVVVSDLLGASGLRILRALAHATHLAKRHTDPSHSHCSCHLRTSGEQVMNNMSAMLQETT